MASSRSPSPLSVALTTTSRVMMRLLPPPLLPLLLLLLLMTRTSSAQDVTEYPVHVDLLDAIDMMDAGIGYAPGIDGYPAFEIHEDTDDIMAPTSLFFAGPVRSEFAILSTFKPYQANSGFLFAIVNPFRNIVQLGVRIQSEGDDGGYTERQRVVLYLTPDPDYVMESRVIANFSIPAVTDQWTRLGLKVDADEIKLYVNCGHVGTSPRTPPADDQHPFLDFETSSVLFLGQAGEYFEDDVPMFLGAVEQLVITGTPSEAEDGTCDRSF